MFLNKTPRFLSFRFSGNFRKMASTVKHDSQYRIPVEDMHRFIVDSMKTTGVNPNHAAQLADLLISADQRGHYSHGLNRLHIYVNDVASGSNAKDGVPKILKQKGSTAWVDGENLLGAVVGNFCMDLAIRLAKEHGVGWVSVKNSNHFGIAGYWALQAAAQGLVGLSFTNASPIIYPTRASEVSLGTNPLSFIASSEHGDNFALDMATSTVALGKVELADRKGKKEVPSVWGADKDGNPTSDPKVILNGGGLLPLGGPEETGGYKGTGLCMMVEILCSIMGGATFGKNVRRWGNVTEPANIGQCFIVVDPECFAEGFSSRLQQFLDQTRHLKPANPEKPVLVPGDPERTHIELGKKIGGLIYHGSQVEYINTMAKKLNVEPCHYEEVSGI